MIKLHKSTANLQYFFTICGKNGRVLATSETYKEKRKAIDAIGVTCANAILACGLKDVTVEDIDIRDLTEE